MNNRAALILVAIFLLSSCRKKNIFFDYYQNGLKRRCSFNVEKGYTIRKSVDDHGIKEWILRYENNSLIFISDDEKNGSNINKLKYKQFGRNISLEFVEKDTLYLSGTDSSGIWREVKNGNLIFGYMNVKIADKEKFDKSITPGCR